MAQMAGSETNVFGSAGAALVSKGMEYLGEVMSLSKTYTNDQDRRRLRVLQDIYVRHHDEIPNNLGVDKETNKPPEVFISGDWEQHCSERLRGKEIGSLRVDIEDILAVIANFLDDRRKYLGSVSSKLYDVYKGDIEELFFAEVIDWVVRCLDCNANDNLIKIIERKILYLTNVMDDLEVFPKQTVHDKSQAFEVIRTINEMLGKLKQKVKTIHDKKFLLNKFEHVANVSEVFLAHFIKGFANFSPKLRRIKAATKENILSVAKKTNTRYEGLFVMFLENAFIRECGSVEELSEDMRKNAGLEFDASNFQKLMADEARDRGILMPDELWKLIPHIFVVAYNLSISMKLINHAISTLSERGTANLFCNSEGGLYFNFLIFDFQRDMAMLYGMLEEFNRGSAGYKCDTYQNTRQQLSKTSELGQHKRFQDIFKNIQSQYEQLNACLQETSHKIREFEGISSEASLKNKRLFYATLRERMVVKGDTVLAERLRCIADAGGLIELEPEAKQEMLATVLAEQDNREMVSDAGASIGISKVVPNGIEAVQLDVIGRRLVGGQKSCVPGRQSDTVAAVTYVQSRHEWPIERERLPLQIMVKQEIAASDPATSEEKTSLAAALNHGVVAKEIALLNDKIKDAYIKMRNYCEPGFFERCKRLNHVDDFGRDLFENILQKMEPMKFYALKIELDAFIKRVEFANKKYPKNHYFEKIFYTVACDLFRVLAQYNHLTSGDSENEVLRLKAILSEHNKKMEQQKKELEERIESLKEQEELLEEKDKALIGKAGEVFQLNFEREYQNGKIEDLTLKIEQHEKKLSAVKEEMLKEMRQQMTGFRNQILNDLGARKESTANFSNG